MSKVGRRRGQLEVLEAPPAVTVKVENAKSTLLEAGTTLLRELNVPSKSYILMVQNDLESAGCIIAASELSHVVVLLPAATRKDLLAYVVQQTSISTIVDPTNRLVTRHGLGESELLPCDSEWIAQLLREGGGVYMLTSGSTGTSKIVACTWTSMCAQGSATQECMFRSRPCRFVLASSIAHAYAINALFAIKMSPFGETSELVLSNRMDALLDSIACPAPGKVTIVFGTPGTYAALNTCAPVKLNVDLAYSAGVAMPEKQRLELKEKFGLALLQNYGSTETGGISAEGIVDSGCSAPCNPLLASVGHLWPGAVVRLDPPSVGIVCPAGEVGELVVRTPWQCKGYVEAGALIPISCDGYYRTSDGGDLIDSFIFVGSRLRPPVMLRIGGLTALIPRHEIEEVLLAHPTGEISDVLIPTQQPSHKIPVVVFFVTTLSCDEVAAYCSATLPAGLTCVWEFRIVDHLPCSAAGKLMYSLPPPRPASTA